MYQCTMHLNSGHVVVMPWLGQSHRVVISARAFKVCRGNPSSCDARYDWVLIRAAPAVYCYACGQPELLLLGGKGGC